MITIITNTECIMFNLSSFESEERFKTLALDNCIDRTGMKLRVNIKAQSTNKTVERVIISTLDIRKIEFEPRYYYESTDKAIRKVLAS